MAFWVRDCEVYLSSFHFTFIGYQLIPKYVGMNNNYWLNMLEISIVTQNRKNNLRRPGWVNWDDIGEICLMRHLELSSFGLAYFDA